MNVRALVASVVVLSPLVAVACSDDPAEVAGGDAGAPSATAPAASSSSPPTTDTPEADAGLITEGGGGDPEAVPDDAGVPVVDAGVDAGACGPGAGDGASLSSACSANLVFLSGGKLTPGTYDLADFTVTGTLSYCGSYAPVKYAGRLDIEASGNAFRLHERVRRVDGPTTRYPSRSYDATASGTSLGITQTCGVATKSKAWGYSVTTSNGKAVLTYTHDLGTATVRFRWVLR